MSGEISHVPGDARFLGGARDELAQVAANAIYAAMVVGDKVYQRLRSSGSPDQAAADLGDLSPFIPRREGLSSKCVANLRVTQRSVLYSLGCGVRTARQTIHNVRAAGHDLDGW